MTFTWANETLILLPERALWWPRQSTLFITDPHFGKAATFRHAGIPICESSHHADLLRLTQILIQTNAQHLIILGDFLHARTGNNPTTLAALTEWRAQFPDLPITLISGNHDRHAGPPAKALNIQTVDGPWPLAPFTCRHEPESTPNHFTLAGHLHPSHRLTASGTGITAPCFHLSHSENLLILPAFGTFTGNSRIQPKPGDKIFLIGPTEVIQVPSAANPMERRCIIGLSHWDHRCSIGLLSLIHQRRSVDLHPLAEKTRPNANKLNSTAPPLGPPMFHRSSEPKLAPVPPPPNVTKPPPTPH